MVFELKDFLYLIGIVVAGVISFLGTRHKLKEYIRDKHDELKNEVTSLKLQLQEQKFRDDLQQQVIDQIGKQMDELIPKLVDELKNKKSGK